MFQSYTCLSAPTMKTMCTYDSACVPFEFFATSQHHVFKSFRRRKKKSSHGSKSQGSQEGMTDIVQMDELEEAERQAAKPAWRTRAFWQSAIPLFVSAVLLTVGTVLATKHYQTQVCCSLACTGDVCIEAYYKHMHCACPHAIHTMSHAFSLRSCAARYLFPFHCSVRWIPSQSLLPE